MKKLTKADSIPSAGTAADSSTKVDATSVRQNGTNPNVGCCTSVKELMQWCFVNCFDSEGQDGIKFVAIDLDEMQSQFDYFLEKEKQQIVNAFTAGQIDIANTFFTEYKSRGLEIELSILDNDKEDGEQYFNNTFKK